MFLEFLKKRVDYISILFLGAVFRFWDLGRELVHIDAPAWNYRAAQFYSFLKTGALEHTLRSYHPGMTVQWLAGFGFEILNQYWELTRGSRIDYHFETYPLIYLSNKIPLVIANLVLLFIAYFLLRKIFSKKAALLGGLFLALDPFYIAHSRRLHLDAMLSGFMLTSLLALIVFFREDKRKFLYFSGALAGGGFLTKLTSWFLIPFVGLLLAVEYLILGKKRYGDKVVDNLSKTFKNFWIWFFAAVLVFTIFCPEMWLHPIDVISYLYRRGFMNTGLLSDEVSGFLSKIPRVNWHFYWTFTLLFYTVCG